MNDFGPKRPMSEDALCVPADTVKTKRGRPKKKPGYDRAEVIDDLLVKAVEFFGTPFDVIEKNGRKMLRLLCLWRMLYR